MIFFLAEDIEILFLKSFMLLKKKYIFSKKVRDIRAKELRAHVSPALIKYLEDNTSAMLSDSHTALLLKEIITHAIG